MSKASVEEIKLGSGGLRGQIAEVLGDAGASHVEETENVLMKFHGTLSAGRPGSAGGAGEGEEGQGVDFHGALEDAGRPDHREAVAHSRRAVRAVRGHDAPNKPPGDSAARRDEGESEGSDCGDLPEWADDDGGLRRRRAQHDGSGGADQGPVHEETGRLAQELSQRFLWRSQAYADIWLDGEKIELDWAEAEVNPAVREKTVFRDGAEPASRFMASSISRGNSRSGIAIRAAE